MPSFVVVAGADVEMGDLEAGNGISARIDLNLHLAPPTNADFLRLGSGSGDEERQGAQEGHLQRRILPRFGPGIHGVFLDLHQENELQASRNTNRPSISARTTAVVHGEASVDETQRGLFYQAGDVVSGNLIPDPQVMRPPILHRIRRYSRPASVVRIGGLEDRSRRFDNVAGLLNQGSDRAKDKGPVRETEESKDASAVKPVGGSDNFECNVCLDIAIEPVVTVCGHMFCWRCLYQWLYVHSDNEECPVCKGSVGESDIIPIYGRGNSSTPVTQGHADEGRVNIPPRPHARRVDGLRQEAEIALGGREDWERPTVAEGDQEGRRAFLHLNEVLSMRRAIRFLQENMGSMLPSRSRLLRRRMSERREHYRTTPTSQSGGNQTLDSAVGDLEARAAYVQDDYLRQLAASRSEAEDRVAVIRARLATLVDTIETHRRHAAAMASSHLDPGVTVVVTQPVPVGVNSPPASELPSVSELAQAVQEHLQSHEPAIAIRRELGEGSASGSGDIDSELLHSRKRRRLN